MGVFYEYYRAVDREAALVEPEHSRVVADPQRGVFEFDAVETKWIDPWVVMVKLANLLRNGGRRLRYIDTVSLYPRPEDIGQEAYEEWDGPTIMELPVIMRDMLADAKDSRLPMAAKEWAKIEEFSDFTSVDMEWMLSLVQDLVGLARRARENDQLLYCWSIL